MTEAERVNRDDYLAARRARGGVALREVNRRGPSLLGAIIRAVLGLS